jgi:hypothetical protein
MDAAGSHTVAGGVRVRRPYRFAGAVVNACVVSILLSAAPVARAEDARHPPAVTPDGAAPVRLAATARRVHLLGAIEFYSLGMYVDSPDLDRARLASPDVAKALRVEITYRESPRRRETLDWRRELIPRLDARATAHLRGTFAPLQRGDVVLIEYSPAKGTAVRVNKAVVVSEAHHDLMLAFLDHWLGQRPVSEEIKTALLKP